MNEFKKRIISDIVPPSKKKVAQKNFDSKPELMVLPTKIQHVKNDFPIQKKQYKSPKFKIIFLASFLIALYVGLSVVFAEMKVEILPKNVSVSLDETIDLSAKASSGKLLFSEISFADKRSGFFSASEKKSIESKASGVVTVFNKNPNSQVLVAGTRFQSVSGKIYKIEKGIVIPLNGSLDVEVIADKSGAEFNEENLVDFTIPAFKEQRSPKFNTIYAKSKTKIIGGFSGNTFVVGLEDFKKAKNILLKEAEGETSQSLTRKIPDDSFLLAQSIKYNVSEEKSEPKAGQAGEKFRVEISGSATGIVVPRESLEKILGKKIANYNSAVSHFKINNIEKLSFDIVGTGSEIKLKAKGIAEFSGALDEISIIDNIFTKKLKSSSAILEALPTASLVRVRFSPFWLRAFPENKERIDIKIGPS